MSSLISSISSSGVSYPGCTAQSKISNINHRCSRRIQLSKFGLVVPVIQSQPIQTRHTIMHTRRPSATTMIHATALNARCSAEQTQTVTRESSTITVAPVQGKEKSPDLDDGGAGFPPRDDDDGGGGGGGGGPGWSGGFFFFGFLAFLGFLKDKEDEGPYKSSRRR